jgi:hypothetical protein
MSISDVQLEVIFNFFLGLFACCCQRRLYPFFDHQLHLSFCVIQFTLLANHFGLSVFELQPVSRPVVSEPVEAR